MSEYIDLEKLPQICKHKVSVDGKRTPLQIGDKMRFNDDDPTAKTVISMTICEDGRIIYTFEWADADGELKQENLTLTELKILAENMSMHKLIAGLAAEQAEQ